jgi:hypothetical protein
LTRLGIRVAYEPSGDPVGSQLVRVKNCASGATLAVGITDEDGLATWAVDANPGPAYFQITGQPGGDRTWDSRDAFNAGIVPMSDIPVVLRGLDGVVGEYIGELEVALGTGNTVTLASGCAVLLGHPVVNLGEQTIAITRPGSLTRIDRLVARLYPQAAATTPGYAVFALLAGTEGGSAPDLTQSADVWEISLAQVSVPVADPITVTDERTYANQRADVTAEVLDDLTSTTSGAGEALSGLSTSLTLSRAATYDIEATLTATQTNTTTIPAHWDMQTSVTTANSLTFSGPRGIGSDSGDNLYVADYGRSRFLTLNSSGTYQSGLTSVSTPRFLCVDTAGVIYGTLEADEVSTYTSAWGVTDNAGFSVETRGIATDDTYVYVVDGHALKRRAAATLDVPGAGWSIFGNATTSGNSTTRMNTPYGVAYAAGYCYIVDEANNRVVKIDAATGLYVTHFSIAAGGRDIDLLSGGDLMVTETTGNRVARYTITGTLVSSFTVTAPYGVTVLSGDVVWVASTSGNTLSAWTETAAAVGGYGQVAVAFDGTPGTYTGIGDNDGAVANSHVTTAAGPTSVTVAAFGKAAADTMTLESACLSVRAVPRR